jgi:putative flippase GtrA
VGLPASHVQDFLGEKGQGEGYLFRLLLTMQRHGIQVVNVPVGAPYRRRGATAGERALGIARIALLPLLFVSSSFLLTCADLCVNFSFYYLLLPGIKPVSIAAGRFTGALVGYLLNRAVVFKRAGRTRQEEAAATAKYAVLFVGMYLSALLLISIMVDEFHWAYALATVIASVLLYAPNYFIQRDVVFRRRQRRPALREGAFHERY